MAVLVNPQVCASPSHWQVLAGPVQWGEGGHSLGGIAAWLWWTCSSPV
jgi:hypothetical protein